MAQASDRLKRLYSNGRFDDEFVEAAKQDLPFVFGRMSLLEEFYAHRGPGEDERTQVLFRQLGTSEAKPRPAGFLKRLAVALGRSA